MLLYLISQCMLSMFAVNVVNVVNVVNIGIVFWLVIRVCLNMNWPILFDIFR
jgi:hypothetical protein